MPRREYTLLFDESGDHFSVDPDDISKRYLGLVGVAVRMDHHEKLAKWIERLKAKHISAHTPEIPVILVRTDILYKRAAFHSLRDDERRAAFDADALTLCERAEYRVFAVVLDKQTHIPREYRRLRHPYHYALHALLERYCRWLRYIHASGNVVAESRGKKEDGALRQAYGEVWSSGTIQGYLTSAEAQATLTSDRIGIKKKRDNVAGLQLADLLANPLTRDVLLCNNRIDEIPGEYGKKIVAAVQSKYNKREDTGRIDGYGRVLLK